MHNPRVAYNLNYSIRADAASALLRCTRWANKTARKLDVLIRVFRIVTPDGDTEYWATYDLMMAPFERKCWPGPVWTIEA
jgi:hypothetical protein